MSGNEPTRKKSTGIDHVWRHYPSGTHMLSRAEQYRQEAEECGELARTTSDPFAQRMYREMERQWTLLSVNARRDPPGRSG